MRKLLVGGLVAMLIGAIVAPIQGVAARRTSDKRQYVVLYESNASLDAAHTALAKAGAKIVSENKKIGVATVKTRNANFVSAVMDSSALAGAARNRPVGYANPKLRAKSDIERIAAGAGSQEAAAGASAAGEPLAGRQWDMEMINATPAGSYAEGRGNKRVLVGIIDTGIQAAHPDIAPNFDWERSRNFTVDIPLVDGACADDPDGSCADPAWVDENGHGSHVGGTVAAPINDFGIAGVAPNVTLVNLRGGQDSGYFFLQPSVDALTYAGRIGVDVVNMSYFIDPWLFNCKNHPDDSPAEQLEQQTIIRATQRALDYAHSKGVTLVAAEGNGASNLGNPKVDFTSPDFPPGTERERKVDNSCLSMPTEGHHVIGVSALGPSGRKAWYSDWSLEQTDVSAPGGDSFDAVLPDPRHRVLAPYPQVALEAEGGLIDPVNGEPISNRVIRRCTETKCWYYRYLQGTSMASPHAVGVAALIVSRYGHTDPAHAGGWTLDPDEVRARLVRTARDRSCPPGGIQRYPEMEPFDEILGPWQSYTAICLGTELRNSFYGHGIVDAYGALIDQQYPYN